MEKKAVFVLILVLFLGGREGSSAVVGWPNSEEGNSASDLEELDDERVYKNPRNSPSADCPRDEEHAEFMGQKCLRKCSNDEDCKSKKKKCLCDGLCGMSCIKPERECEEVTSPALGAVTLSGRLFGDRAVYTCDPGYHLIGLRERVCRGDGSWAGVTPSCRQNVYCKSPPRLDHARHNALPQQTTFTVNTTLQYQCHEGYVTTGFPTAMCLAVDATHTAMWYGPDITCEPRSCGTPSEPSFGWHIGECYSFGCKIVYKCSEGSELTGKPDRVCQADGTWFPRDMPVCVPVECPPPESPSHGTAVYTSCAYNSVVSYECHYGYTLLGESTRRCGADRKWSGSTPKCQEIECGPPGPLYNGWLENIETGTGLGASVIFRCQEDMLLVGNASSVCQVDGTWRYPTPLCLAPCVVPAVAQGNLTIRSNVSQPDELKVAHGTEVLVHCEERYEPSGNSTPVVCNNGTWSHIPRCQPASCKYMAKAPKNGMVIAPKTEHGMKARYRCKDGYVLRGANTTECRYGNWTGELPYCQEVYCPFPGYVDNGKVLLVGNMGLYDYRPYVRKVTNNKQIMYDCNRGYVLAEGPPGATCVGGHWSPKQLPRCVPGMHPRLRWSRSVRARRDLRAMALMKLRRMRRALVSTSSVIRKPATTSNKPEQSLAAGGSGGGGRNRGGGKEKATHGEATAESAGTTGEGSRTSEGTGEEQEGAKGSGRAQGKQKKPGSRGKGGPCDGIQVETFMKVEVVKRGRGGGDQQGNATSSGYPHGTGVRLTCAQGYSSNLPNGTAKCVRGRWKPVKPHCGFAACHVPDSEHGIYTRAGATSAVAGTALEAGGLVAHAQTVEFSCRVGYNVQGTATMKCWHGQWSIPVLPSCTPAPCQLPVIGNGQYLLGYRPGLTIGNGSSVRFQCDAEYKATSTAPVQCILGELRPKSPHCKKDPGSMFMAGGDITKAGEMGAIDYMTGLRGSCGPPARVQGSLAFKNGEPLAEAERNFPDGTEVTFNCIASIMGEKITWRIICEDGNWLGRSLTCDITDGASSEGGPGSSGMGSSSGHGVGIGGGPMSSGSKDNTTCVFRNSEMNVATFYMDQPVTEDIVEFPSGALLMFRCMDIGKYAMIGSNRRRCVNGEWEGQRPVCFGLNQENDYALEKPPTILFRHQLGPIAQSNDGKLIVYPATVLHMECLWIRRFGTPKWVVSHNYRKYPESWSSDPGRDSQLEYRLSIFHASRDDSGTFTCITPTRHTHSVEIEVKAIHCPVLPSRRGLKKSTEDTKMNTKVTLSCINGNSLIGAHELTCLPSGNWSAHIPVCESMECPDLGTLSDGNLRASILSREVGGQVVFSCTPGYGLNGPAHSTCLPTGEWATPLPTCREVQCPAPGVPENGFVQGGAAYKAGDLVQFGCNPDHMMEGQPIIACQENGRWSGAVPKCVKACSYPGTVISGRMSSVKFYYQIGETVSFTCDAGLVMHGASMLRCLRTGKWSNTIPTCVLQSGASAPSQP